MFNKSRNWEEVPIMMVFWVILKQTFKAYFRLISSMIKSRIILERLQWNIKWSWDSFCSLHLGPRIFGVLPILCIAGFKGREKSISLYKIENI